MRWRRDTWKEWKTIISLLLRHVPEWATGGRYYGETVRNDKNIAPSFYATIPKKL